MNTLQQLNVYSTSSVFYTDQALGSNQVLSKRYTINGLLDTAQPVSDNIEKLCNASGSWLSYDNHEGKWGVVINNSGTSIVSFNDSNILDNISISSTGLADLYNSVKVQFPHKNLKDSSDFIQVDLPDGDKNANEQPNTLNLTYDIVNEPVQANLLGFIELKQSRLNLVINFRTDYTYIYLKAGDLIDVTNPRLGFTNKVFRIITVAETQDDGPLTVEITALEYDANVYSTADLYRYTRTDADGIITIGNIGVPGTPQVTKYELDARPRMIVTSLAPSGIVDGMEFWYSKDVNLDEASRSYIQLATIRPKGKATFDQGETVTIDYDNVDSGSYVFKTRGTNATTVGPYSTPSGLILFTATQLTSAIGPDTKAVSALGNLVTALAVVDLLKGVDGLYQKIANTSSLFTSIFETFKDVTGIDLVGQASNGSLVVASNLEVKDEGSTVTTATSALNFVGDGVVATNNGGIVTVTIGAGGTIPPNPTVPVITGISPNNGPTTGGTRVTISGVLLDQVTKVEFGAGNEGTDLNIISSTSIEVTTPVHAADIVTVLAYYSTGTATYTFTYGEAGSAYLSIDARYPPDRNTYQNPEPDVESNLAPISGSYWIRYGKSTPFYGALTKGYGDIKLYKSDGTLVQNLTQDDLIIHNNLVEIPFSARELGTDYYILMDRGTVEYCGIPNIEITEGAAWNFNTPLYATTPYAPESSALGDKNLTAVVTSVSPVGNNVCRKSRLTVNFDKKVVRGTGNLYIKNFANNATIATIGGLSGSVSTASYTILYDTLENLGVPYDTQFYVSADSGFAITAVDLDCYVSDYNPVAISGNSYRGTATQMVLTGFTVDSTPLTDPTRVKVNPQTNIGLVFNRTPYFGTGDVKIYKSDGALHQSISVTTSFSANKTNELIWIGANKTVYINPTKDLTLGATYYIQVDSGAFTDGCDTFDGISDTSTVRFTVDPGPTATSTPFSTTATNIVLSYDRPIEPGPGKIRVFDSENNEVSNLASTNANITYS